MANPISNRANPEINPSPSTMGSKVKIAITMVALAALAALTKIAFDMEYLPFTVIANPAVALGIVAVVLGIALIVLLAIVLKAKKEVPPPDTVPQPNPDSFNAPAATVFNFLVTNDVDLKEGKKLTFDDIPGLEPLVDTIEHELEVEENLRAKLRAGAEAYAESSIKKYVPDPDSKQKLLARLELVLKQEYVNAQLREKGKFTLADTHEQMVLKHLDYDTLKYRNKHILLNLIQTTITNHYEELVEQSKTVQELKVKITNIAQTSRLKAASVPDDLIPRLQSFLQVTQTMKGTVLTEIELRTPTDQYTNGVSHRINKEIVETHLRANQRKLASNAIDTYLVSEKTRALKGFKTHSEGEWNESVKEFESKFFVKLPHFLRQDKLTTKMMATTKIAAFFGKWDAKILTNVVQGWDNESDALGCGVCYANSIRLGAREQNSSHVTELDQEPCGITASDRVNQALYIKSQELRIKELKINPQPLAASSSAPDVITQDLDVDILNEILKRVDSAKKGSVISATHELFTNDSTIEKLIVQLENDLKDNSTRIKDSKGVVLVNLSLGGAGHSIYIRVDDENQVYRLHDPNLGRVKAENQQELMAFMRDLFKASYSEITGYTLMQMT